MLRKRPRPQTLFTLVNKELMKRFVLIEKAKEKQIFGVLINSPTLLEFQTTLLRIKTLLKLNIKKFYTIIIHNITDEKLGNFQEIEVCESLCLFRKRLLSINIYTLSAIIGLKSGKTMGKYIVLTII